MTDNKTLKLTLEVDYDLQGTEVAEMRESLEQVVLQAVNRGGITGYSEAVVEDYRYSVKDATAAQADDIESKIGDHLLEQIESGAIDLGDIVKEMVRFGMMDSADFTNRMVEQMALNDKEASTTQRPRG